MIGLAPTQFNYDDLTKAFRLIKNQGAPLIAIHKARYFATKGGLSLGPGKARSLDISRVGPETMIAHGRTK